MKKFLKLVIIFAQVAVIVFPILRTKRFAKLVFATKILRRAF